MHLESHPMESAVQPRAAFRRSRRLAVVAPLLGVAFIAAACGSTATTADQYVSEGLTAQKAGNYTQAISDYQKAVTLKPTDSSALYDLGVVEQVDTNDPGAAETHYRAAIALNPKFTNALYNLAILVTPTNPVEASELYTEAVTVLPTDAAAWLNLGYVQISLGQKKTGDADIAKAAALNPAYAKDLPTATTLPTGKTTTTTRKATTTT